MEKRKINLENDVISYSLTRRKTKRIILKVKQDGEISITASHRVPLYTIEDFIISKYDWIKKSRKKFDAIHTEGGRGLKIFGEEVRVNIVYADCRKVIFKDGEITIIAYKTDKNSNIQKIFDKWYNNLACEYLKEVSDYVYENLLSDKFPRADLKLRFMSSRWGSCYYNKNLIILNKHLIQLKKPLIEQVIIHEYSHFLHHNHSEQFKTFLRTINPNSDEFEKILSFKSQSNTIIEKIV